MTIDVTLPSLAPSMTEGRIGNWLKRVGDVLRAGEPIAEIESEKTVTELESPVDGCLVEILVPAGTGEIAVGTVLARIGERSPGTVAVPPRSAETSDAAPAGAPRAVGGTTPERLAAATAAPTGAAASELATRVARLLDLPLPGAPGSGPHGRVMLRDLPVRHTRPAAGIEPSPGPPAAPALQPAPEPGPRALVPHNALRRVTARRLTEAKQNIPHFYLQTTVEVDRLLALRAEINAGPAAGDAVRISLTDCFVRAAALAIGRFPDVNASWTEEGMQPHDGVDVAVAVATPGGLVTPVLRRANCLTLREIARQTGTLVVRARTGALAPDEYQGGSCTISNLGMYGVDSLYAIVNPPQSFILGVGRAAPTAMVRNGKLEPGSTMRCTLSGDHRAIDGATGAQLLGAIRELIENPLHLLL